MNDYILYRRVGTIKCITAAGLERSLEVRCSQDGKDEEEKEADEQNIQDLFHRLEQGLHNKLQARIARYESQRPERSQRTK